MKFIIFSAILLVAGVSAQNFDSGSTVCAAQNILEACLSTTQGYLSQCSTTDYNCLCDKYTSIMTCFNNCPADARTSSTASQKDLYCMNASIYSSMSAKTAIASSTITTISESMAATTTGTSDTTGESTKEPKTSATKVTAGAAETNSKTAFATGATQSNGAAELIGNASGMLVVAAGIVAVVL